MTINRKKKEAPNKEIALSAINEAIKSNLDLEQVLNIACLEILKLFQTDKVIIAICPETKDYSQWSLIVEHNIKQNIPRISTSEFSTETQQFLATHLLTKDEGIIIEDLEKSDYPEPVKNIHLKNGIKSILGISIKRGDDKYGILGIFSMKATRSWTDKDVSLLKLISDQVYTAIKYDEYSSIIKQQARREALLREIVNKIRSSLDINEILTYICDEVAKLFKVQRASILQFPSPDWHEKYIIKREYKASAEIKGLSNNKNYKLAAQYWGKLLLKDGIILSIDNIAESDTPDYFKKYYNALGVKSVMGVPIKQNGDIWGTIVLSEYNYNRHWSNNEKELLHTISSQIYIAIKQAELYSKEKQAAEKEKLLREIVSNIKISQNLDSLFDYIVKKLSETFTVNRVIFIENPTYEFQKPYIKYEYLQDKQVSTLVNVRFPESIFKELQKKTKKTEPVHFVNNAKTFDKNNEEIQEFFENYSIDSFMTIPLARYNNETKILGYFMLCASELREWTYEESNLLMSITESIVNIIWELSKLIEINELRNTFTITLAHDIQVPLVGQQKALEFLASRQYNEPIGKYLPFIHEAIESNKDLFDMLTRVIDSYNYELNRKHLDIKKHNITLVIYEVVGSLTDLAEKKSITLNFDIPDNLPDMNIDKDQIKNAIYHLLENALTYTQIGGNVVISSFYLENSLSICISDNGPGITKEVRERLFERYAMAQVIGRKIGSGLGLYLTKQIVNAHNGSIFYTTEIGEGSTFCILLPISG